MQISLHRVLRKETTSSLALFLEEVKKVYCLEFLCCLFGVCLVCLSSRQFFLGLVLVP